MLHKQKAFDFEILKSKFQNRLFLILHAPYGDAIFTIQQVRE